MTAALSTPPTLGSAPAARVTIRPAPRREPPFDDELDVLVAGPGPLDQRLPFTVVPAPRVWVPSAPRPRTLPDPAAWGRRFLVGLTEAAAGHRPVHQLAGMLSPSIGRGLASDFERTLRHGRSHWLHRATVRSVRASEPAPGVAEGCATLDTGRRVRAVAFRLEEYRGHWRCTRLQLG